MRKRMSIVKGKKTEIGTILYNHIIKNKRWYLITIILFFIGVIIGVLFVNNAKYTHIENIHTYLNDLIDTLKRTDNIDLFSLFKQSAVSNFILITILWFGASTIIGIPVVYGAIVLKGFSIGYTISSFINCFGVGKGIIFSLAIMLLHNIIFIPTMFATSVSGVRLYHSIMKNKNRDNIKIEILRHTMFCILMSILMTISSLIEIYISTNLFVLLLKKM